MNNARTKATYTALTFLFLLLNGVTGTKAQNHPPSMAGPQQTRQKMNEKITKILQAALQASPAKELPSQQEYFDTEIDPQVLSAMGPADLDNPDGNSQKNPIVFKAPKVTVPPHVEGAPPTPGPKPSVMAAIARTSVFAANFCTKSSNQELWIKYPSFLSGFKKTLKKGTMDSLKSFVGLRATKGDGSQHFSALSATSNRTVQCMNFKEKFCANDCKSGWCHKSGTLGALCIRMCSKFYPEKIKKCQTEFIKRYVYGMNAFRIEQEEKGLFGRALSAVFKKDNPPGPYGYNPDGSPAFTPPPQMYGNPGGAGYENQGMMGSPSGGQPNPYMGGQNMGSPNMGGQDMRGQSGGWGTRPYGGA